MEGNRYNNQQEFGERMYYRAQAMSQDHLMYQGGQMYRIRNQEKSQLNEAMTLQNGTKVNLMEYSNEGSEATAAERWRMSWHAGNRYENQDRFRDGMENKTGKEW